ncbi:MAG: hypothetical protein GY769_18430 [bacterium]|nr:hypothetical protein [bacterium]
MRTRDLEQQDNLKAACLASLLASLWLGGCVVLMFRYWGQMSEAQLVMAGLAAGCFLVSAVFMGTRAYLIRKAR